MCIQLHLRLPQVFSIYFAIENSNLMTNSDLCSNGFVVNAYGSFFLCSPDCPKQPRTSFPFYKFFYDVQPSRVGSLLLLIYLDRLDPH